MDFIGSYDSNVSWQTTKSHDGDTLKDVTGMSKTTKHSQMTGKGHTDVMSDNWRTLPIENCVSWALQRVDVQAWPEHIVLVLLQPKTSTFCPSQPLAWNWCLNICATSSRVRFRNVENFHFFALLYKPLNILLSMCCVLTCMDYWLFYLRRFHSINLAWWKDTNASKDITLVVAFLACDSQKLRECSNLLGSCQNDKGASSKGAFMAKFR